MREAGQPVLVRDRLALLGQLEPARADGPGGCARIAACVGPPPRPALPPRPWKIVSSMSRSAGQRGERLLGAVVLPGRRQVAAVLARVGVAEHHLEPAAAALDERAEALVVEQRGDGRRRLAEVGDRLEERHEREVLADLRLRQVERPQQVVRARRCPRR